MLEFRSPDLFKSVNAAFTQLLQSVYHGVAHINANALKTVSICTYKFYRCNAMVNSRDLKSGYSDFFFSLF